MKKLLLIILCVLLVCGCASNQGNIGNDNTVDQEDTIIENGDEAIDQDIDEGLHLNTYSNEYVYVSKQLEFNAETKPMLEKIAIDITKKDLMRRSGGRFDETELDNGKYYVYFIFNDLNELDNIFLRCFIEDSTDNKIYKDWAWVEYVSDSYRVDYSRWPLNLYDENMTGTVIKVQENENKVYYNIFYEVNGNELHEIERHVSYDPEQEIDVFTDVIRYRISDDVLNRIKNTILEDPKIQYYLKVNNFKDIRIDYKNELEVYADDESIPFLTIWLDKNSNFTTSYDFNYTYNFKYTKDNEVRNATLYFEDSYGGYYAAVHPKYSLVKLIANGQEFNFYYRDGNLSADYVTPMIFTEDLHTKVLAFFDEYFRNDFDQDYRLLINISNIIKEQGTKYTFSPIKMGERIDARIQEFDSIKPLVSRQCNEGNTYNLTPYYMVEIGNLYGLVNEDHELVLPVVNEPITVWFNDVMFGVDFNTPNETIYNISGGFGGGYNLYMHDNANVYTYSQGDDGPPIVNKQENFNLKHISIPIELITITDYVKSQAIVDYYEYVYDTRGYGMMDGSGNILTTEIYDGIANVLNDYVYVHRDGLYGFLNTKGEEIIPLMYEDAMYVYNEQAIVMKDGKYGAITMNNDVIVDFKYEKLSYFGKNCYVGLIEDTWEIINLE